MKERRGKEGVGGEMYQTSQKSKDLTSSSNNNSNEENNSKAQKLI